MDIKGLDKVVQTLRARAARLQAEGNPAVEVGYTAAYAVYVHEDLEAAHKEGKQAKFLEQPARDNRAEYAGIVKEALRQGKTLAQALLLAGLALQRDSQQLVPIDTGNLRASAFTRLGGGRND